jgi:hypothetical protein
MNELIRFDDWRLKLRDVLVPRLSRDKLYPVFCVTSPAIARVGS